ncbi:MAG: hypothetical protein RL026_2440 [Pseudomonadota bacterium]
MHRLASCAAHALAALFLLPTTAAAGIEVELKAESAPAGAQARAGAREASGFLVLRNTGGVARSLLKLTSTAADRVELRQLSVGADGAARLWPVARFQLQPGETARLQLQGRHLHFTGLRQPAQQDQRLPVTFVFEDEPPLSVELPVRLAP